MENLLHNIEKVYNMHKDLHGEKGIVTFALVDNIDRVTKYQYNKEQIKIEVENFLKNK